jgi:hypothetical protein
MKKSEPLRALQTEIHRHTFDYFVENPPSMAEGGKGVVVPGCPPCRKQINAMAQFLGSSQPIAAPLAGQTAADLSYTNQQGCVHTTGRTSVLSHLRRWAQMVRDQGGGIPAQNSVVPESETT